VFKKNKAFRSAKLNHMRLEGESNDACGPAFAPGVTNSGHEIAKGQRFSGGMSFSNSVSKTNGLKNVAAQ
jgi:hypothetical protein